MLKDGRFAYIAPFYTQAKAVAWDYLKHYAEPFLASRPNESELRVDLKNGARIRIYGADNADALRGIMLDGVVLDEYGQFRGNVWGEILRPTLADRKGWAVFIGTPKGRVGLYDIWAGKGKWKGVKLFRQMLRASETGLLDDDELDDLWETMTEEEYMQEMECSFEAALVGAIYGKQMSAAEKDGRICGTPYDPGQLVNTAWDLGIGKGALTCIWFQQKIGREIHIIDYYENSGVDIGHYASVLQSKGYNYGTHWLPHDAEPAELSSGRSIKETLENLNIGRIECLPQDRVENGINAARLLIPQCWFDEHHCEQGIEALRQYRYEYDEKLQSFKLRPVHDWSSHAADAFRYLAQGLGSGPSGFSGKLKPPELGIV